ncbi:MAG: putative toxin [Candidatus Micrarchaeota archaeon]
MESHWNGLAFAVNNPGAVVSGIWDNASAQWNSGAYGKGVVVGTVAAQALLMYTPGGGAGKMRRVRQLGRLGEKAAGITGPKVGVRVPGTTRMVFPDRYLVGRSVTEVKNVAYLYDCPQLRNYRIIAESEGIPFYLWIRRTTVLSRPLMELRDAGKITVRYIP